MIYSNENFYKFVGQIGKLVKLRKYTRSFTNKVPVLTDFVLMLILSSVLLQVLMGNIEIDVNIYMKSLKQSF